MTLTRRERRSRESVVPHHRARHRSDGGSIARGRIVAIDGLRALAVLGVMAFHFGLPLNGGFLGVDLFFVISGFVITRMLRAEWATPGAVNLGAFWLARVKRLLPALITVLLAVQLWMHLGAGYRMQNAANEQTLAALFYGSNWYEMFNEGGYWQVDRSLAPLTHLWSLAVEEQFYLVWPLVFIALVWWVPPRMRGALVAAAAALSYILAAVLADPTNTDRVYQGTDTRSGALLLGALVALTVGSRFAAWTTQWWAAAASVAVLAVLWVVSDGSTLAFYVWQLPVAGIAAAVLVSHLALGGAVLTRALSWRPFVLIGAISYGLYLWHWPVWVFLSSTPFVTEPVAQLGTAFVASFVLAASSYLLIERPIRRVSGRTGWMLGAFAGAMILVAMSAIFFQPGPPAEQSTGIIVTG